MSKQNVLSKFKKVIVATTNKDAYVPQYSAVIRPLSKVNSSYKSSSSSGVSGADAIAQADEEVRALIEEMGHSLLSPIDPNKLLRIYIDNAIETAKTATVDTMIGRSAHISYLENMAVVRSIFHLISPLLCPDNTL